MMAALVLPLVLFLDLALECPQIIILLFVWQLHFVYWVKNSSHSSSLHPFKTRPKRTFITFYWVQAVQALFFVKKAVITACVLYCQPKRMLKYHKYHINNMAMPSTWNSPQPILFNLNTVNAVTKTGFVHAYTLIETQNLCRINTYNKWPLSTSLVMTGI